MSLFGNIIARKNLNFDSNAIIGSCDEVGRGCLFGPVVACAVILKDDCNIPELNDSKKLSQKKRESLFDIIKENCISYSIIEIDNNTIDNINILQATMLAMGKAIQTLSIKPDQILIDGNYFKDVLDLKIPYTTIVKGDAKYQSIAAASILAKVYRDNLIQNIAESFQGYDLHSNKGYGTKKHLEGIRKLGFTNLHRKSFNVKL